MIDQCANTICGLNSLTLPGAIGLCAWLAFMAVVLVAAIRSVWR